jgi:hypothetical protein
MIACVIAVLLHISSVISWLVRIAQRTVLSSHLIEYEPYAIVDGFSRWRRSAADAVAPLDLGLHLRTAGWGRVEACLAGLTRSPPR